MEPAELAQWTPIRLTLERPEPTVDWCDLRGVSFREPFFMQTVARWANQGADGSVPPRPVIRTALSALEAVDGIGECLTPSGFIFHMSRCGSTVLSRLFGTVPDTMVISEADPINSFLEADPNELNEAALVACLRLMIRALGRKRFGEEAHYVVKFSSWNVRRLAPLLQAFPDVPRIFVYRDPVEVISSVLSGSPGWMQLQRFPAQAEYLLGIPAADCEGMPVEEFCARSLAGFCAAALDGDDGRTLFVDYRDLPDVAWGRAARHFQIPLAHEHVARMRDEARYYAKDTERRPFVADGTQKQQATPEIKALADRWLGPLFQEMQARRATAAASSV
jgi:hypothetical protein